ncbi:hypothetical protein L228DRAFT_53192 [Xylona heveae TC161]|uniref:Uncharacterized protein n=1 Tax=Xylona heveae (strain CBS 132557 / TC161) TaxID=1328760 RepID=A0A164ZFZ8_XYLHT|nr:hypothetical protein L228DRAFT_53192 [Xylona heveae TC161]KZF19055.1 hypothetical protein L228DRAFT_53192 [Xylona heveae TC161]
MDCIIERADTFSLFFNIRFSHNLFLSIFGTFRFSLFAITDRFSFLVRQTHGNTTKVICFFSIALSLVSILTNSLYGQVHLFYALRPLNSCCALLFFFFSLLLYLLYYLRPMFLSFSFTMLFFIIDTTSGGVNYTWSQNESEWEWERMEFYIIFFCTIILLLQLQLRSSYLYPSHIAHHS